MKTLKATVPKKADEAKPDFRVLLGDREQMIVDLHKMAVETVCDHRAKLGFGASGRLDKLLTLAKTQPFDLAILSAHNIWGCADTSKQHLTEVIEALPQFRARISGPLLLLCEYPLDPPALETVLATGARCVDYAESVREIAQTTDVALERKLATATPADSPAPTS